MAGGGGSFTSPTILFLGNLGAPERDWTRAILAQLWASGRYERYVEPGVGAFALAVVARSAGIPAAAMDLSDVGLYSAVCGALYSGTPMRDLGVAVDGLELELPSDPMDAATLVLWTQLLLRMEARPEVAYFRDLVTDLRQREAEHRTSMAAKLGEQAKLLQGIRFGSADIFDHIERVADDDRTIIVADPPSYRAGFERFYRTGGRLTWAEPDYTVWDPATHFEELIEPVAKRPAMLLLYQEAAAGRRPIQIQLRPLRDAGLDVLLAEQSTGGADAPADRAHRWQGTVPAAGGTSSRPTTS